MAGGTEGRLLTSHEGDSDSDGNTDGSTDGNGGSDGSGGGANLPQGWPEELALPAGTTIELANSMGGGETLMVIGNLEGEARDVQDHFRSQLLAAGYEMTTDNYTELDGEQFAPLAGESERGEVGVLIQASEGMVSISIVFEPDND